MEVVYSTGQYVLLFVWIGSGMTKRCTNEVILLKGYRSISIR